MKALNSTDLSNLIQEKIKQLSSISNYTTEIEGVEQFYQYPKHIRELIATNLVLFDLINELRETK